MSSERAAPGESKTESGAMVRSPPPALELLALQIGEAMSSSIGKERQE